MDREVFTDVTLGDRHEVDVLMKARFQDEGLLRDPWKSSQTGIVRDDGRKEMLVMRQLKRRLGTVSNAMTTRLDQLQSEQLDEIGEERLDFQSMADAKHGFPETQTRHLKLH